MRNHHLLLAATTLFAACADDQHATAPINAGRARSNTAADAGVSTQAAVNPQAKPTDQVGFTTVTEATSAAFQVLAGTGHSLVATCPAGTTVIGGTYAITDYQSASTPPWIVYNRRDAQNGWTVGVSNEQLGGGSLRFTVTAYCAS